MANATKALDQAGLTQVWGRIETLLAGKANTSHTHAQSDVTGLADALAGKANTQHTHTVSQVTDLTDTLANYALKSDITGAYIYKGSVATVGDLPQTATVGDVYDVQDGGMNYAWNGTSWDALGSIATVDLTGYYTKAQVDAGFATKTHTHAQSDITGLESALSTINTSLGTKADANTVTSLQSTVSTMNTTLSQKADSSNVYAKTETYTQSEVNSLIPQALTTEEIADIIGA